MTVFRLAPVLDTLLARRALQTDAHLLSTFTRASTRTRALRSLLARFVARDRCEASSDLYVASHCNRAGPNDAPTMRILLRHAFSPTDAPEPEITERDLGIELAICDAVARSCGGTLSISEPSAAQIVVVIDLPAPA